jgi:sugar lactone lactonase YvrE
LIKFDIPDKLTAKEKRFNEGVCDPAGRLLAGTLGYEHGSKDGRMFAIDGTGSSTLVLDGITCTNGMGWSQDTRTMYFTDSWIKEIAAFDYDIVRSFLLYI